MLRNIPFALDEQFGRSMALDVIRRLKSGMPQPTAAEIAAQTGPLDRFATRVDSGEIVILPLRGIIEHRLSIWGYWFGGTSCDLFSAAFQASIDDSTVKKIVIDCDSPGGSYPGIPELATQIFAQRDAKGANGVVAVSNPQCCSGAYWISSAAQKLFTIGSGEAGSIGCFEVHTEFAKAYEMEGITNTVIRDPEGKAAWNPWEPLSEAERTHEQQRITDIANEFMAAVAKHRGVSKSEVASKYGQGRTLSAKQCVAAGMCDGIRTVEQVIGRSQKSSARRTEGIVNPRLRMKSAG